jgi:hypothetical protein
MEGVSVVKDWTDEESVVWLQQESNSMGLQNNKTTITHSHALTRLLRPFTRFGWFYNQTPIFTKPGLYWV